MENVKNPRRCKWWNRGFCWERDGFTFNHQKGDCQEYLNSGCAQIGCTTLRYRKPYRHFKSSLGCHRGENSAYLPKLEKDNMENEAVDNIKDSQEVEKEVVNKTVGKKVQTEAENKCFCEIHFEGSDVIMQEDKIICVHKRAKCDDTESKEYEEKVESEMDLKYL